MNRYPANQICYHTATLISRKRTRDFSYDQYKTDKKLWKIITNGYYTKNCRGVKQFSEVPSGQHQSNFYIRLSRHLSKKRKVVAWQISDENKCQKRELVIRGDKC